MSSDRWKSRVWGVGVLAVMAAGLGGCTAKYTAEIRNATTVTLDARMVHDKLVADPIELDSALIEPGATVMLGPASVPLTDPVRLTVVPARDRGNVPQRRAMSRGVSRFVVEHEGEPAYGALRLRLIDHSSPISFGASSDGGIEAR